MLEDSSERAVNVIDYVNVIVMLSIQLLCLKENDTDTQRDVSCRCAAKP